MQNEEQSEQSALTLDSLDLCQVFVSVAISFFFKSNRMKTMSRDFSCTVENRISAKQEDEMEQVNAFGTPKTIKRMKWISVVLAKGDWISGECCVS